jgi:hypothetical protein
VPDDGRPPVVLARACTAASAQNVFGVHAADLRLKGEPSRVVLVNTERQGRFTGGPIRDEVLQTSAPGRPQYWPLKYHDYEFTDRSSSWFMPMPIGPHASPSVH